jgi:hypothetical protein
LYSPNISWKISKKHKRASYNKKTRLKLEYLLNFTGIGKQQSNLVKKKIQYPNEKQYPPTPFADIDSKCLLFANQKQD